MMRVPRDHGVETGATPRAQGQHITGTSAARDDAPRRRRPDYSRRARHKVAHGTHTHADSGGDLSACLLHVV